MPCSYLNGVAIDAVRARCRLLHNSPPDSNWLNGVIRTGAVAPVPRVLEALGVGWGGVARRGRKAPTTLEVGLGKWGSGIVSLPLCVCVQPSIGRDQTCNLVEKSKSAKAGMDSNPLVFRVPHHNPGRMLGVAYMRAAPVPS